VAGSTGAARSRRADRRVATAARVSCETRTVFNRTAVIRRVARDPTLRRIELGYLCFATAEHATWLAGTLYAYSNGGVGEAGIVAAVLLAPSLVVAPIASFAADRFPSGGVLAAGYSVQCLAMALAGILIATDAPSLAVYAAAMVAAAAVTTTRPTIGVVLPNTTRTPADLTAANVLIGFLEDIGKFVGPILTGVLAAAFGLSVAFLVCGSMMAAATIGALRLPRIAIRLPSDTVMPSAVRDTLDGLRALRSDRPVRLLIGAMSMGCLVAGAADVLFVASAAEISAGGAGAAGVLGTAFGIGAMCGAASTVTLVGRARLTPFVAVAVAALGVSMALLGLVDTIAVAAVMFAALGAGESVLRIAAVTMIQRVAPAEVIGRYFGLAEGVTMFAMATGSVTIAAIVATLGYPVGLVASGIAIPVALLVILPALLRVDRHSVAPDDRTLELITGDPIFGSLPAPTIERLSVDARRVRLAPGDVALREGDKGDNYFVVDEGRLSLTAGGKQLHELEPGDGFGELALLHETPRTATATALTDVVLVVIEREYFLQAVTRHPRSLAVGRDRTDRYLGPH
jgi:MFS family permease